MEIDIFDIRDIRKGFIRDVILEKGDVIYLSRGCVDGKLLPPTGPIILRGPGGTDEPPRNNKRNNRS